MKAGKDERNSTVAPPLRGPFSSSLLLTPPVREGTAANHVPTSIGDCQWAETPSWLYIKGNAWDVLAAKVRLK